MFFRQGAHDIQNLLNAVQLWLTTNSASDKEQTRQMLQELQDYYTNRIDGLRRSFQEFRSIRRRTLPVEAVDVSRTVRGVLDDWKERIDAEEGGEVDIEASLSSEVILLFSEVHIKNAVHALLDNAWRYRSDLRKLQVKVNVRSISEGAEIAVQDNGTGIDTDRFREQLFQPFVRCTSRSEGQGISLHLIKVMAEQNGGSASLESQPGIGTTVTLRLISQA